MHAAPAYTGVRRGEVLGLRWSEVDFERGGVLARSRKQSRHSAETARLIDLYPDPEATLCEWRVLRPTGQYVACDDGVAGPLLRHHAAERFAKPLRGTRWATPMTGRPGLIKIGFRAYRHRVASNLAAAGVDRRVVDELMGHATEVMRKYYRHPAPAETIDSLAFGPAAMLA